MAMTEKSTIEVLAYCDPVTAGLRVSARGNPNKMYKTSRKALEMAKTMSLMCCRTTAAVATDGIMMINGMFVGQKLLTLAIRNISWTR